MKAIQIIDVNRELLNAWGEKEELTWTNSFGSLVGSVLVVDDNLPQGYGVRTNTTFLDDYRWASNFGTKGWSDIKRVSDMDAESEPEEEFIFILWNTNADSWIGGRSMKSIHKTLDGAVEEIPAGIRTKGLKRDPDDMYVVNYSYMAVEKRALKD